MRILFIAVLAIVALAPVALAQTPSSVPIQTGPNSVSPSAVPVLTNPTASQPSGTNVKLINPLNSGDCTPNGNCLMNFLNRILAFVVRIGAIVVVLMLVFVGYKFVAARGEPAKITEARGMLLWTVVGALILLGAQVIAMGIEATVKALSVGG